MKLSNIAFDNLKSTIQVHYINFIKNFVNYIIEHELKSKKDLHFENIDYDFKKKVSFDYFQSLKKLKIKDILQNEITKKSKIKNKNHNIEAYNEIINSTNINLAKNVRDMNYLVFIKKFYYTNGRKKDKISIEGQNIIFSKATKPFYELCKNNIHYNQKLKNTIQIAYFDEYE